MSMGLLSKFAGLTPRLSARSFRRGGVLLYASVAAHPAPMATAARLHGLVWRVRYVARNMLDRSTSVVHAWTEQGGIERPKRRFGQATGDANDERSGCCAWFESWRELGKWRCYCIARSFNGTRRVEVHSHVSRSHVIAVGRVEVVEATGVEKRRCSPSYVLRHVSEVRLVVHHIGELSKQLG